jgi:hypothetical protein
MSKAAGLRECFQHRVFNYWVVSPCVHNHWNFAHGVATHFALLR